LNSKLHVTVGNCPRPFRRVVFYFQSTKYSTLYSIANSARDNK